MRWGARCVVVLGFTAAVGCGSGPNLPPSPTPASAATLTPATVSLVSLTGVITSQGGSKLSDATVTILDGPNALRFIKTNSLGAYRFDNLIPGNANLSAVKTGYEERRDGLYIDGVNTLGFILRTAQPWNIRGGADANFDLPSYVTRVLIQATWKGTGPSNFGVSVGGVVIVDTVLGGLPNGTYTGTHAVSGGRAAIYGSSNVAISWSFTEVR